MSKQRVFSGIQPTGLLHIGNYLGALKQWLAWQDTHEAFFGIVDLHALTVPQEPAKLREATLTTAATLLALGLDPKRCALMIQSHVPQHSELMWLLTTVTPLSRLKEMIQFKEKSKKQGKDVNTGLFTYPVLMAADILLYDVPKVPVGEDQIQHVELARLIARKFNNRFGKIFVEPQPQILATSSRVMSLTNPHKKMSKSDIPKSFIGIFEEPRVIEAKIKSAVTDSGREVIYEPNLKPALANLLNLGAALESIEAKEFAAKFAGSSYAEFKAALAGLIVEFFAPAKQRYDALLKHPDNIHLALEHGADKAKEAAEIKMAPVRKAMGLVN